MTQAVITLAATGDPYGQHRVPGFYPGNSGAHFNDNSGALMAGNAGKGWHSQNSIEDREIGVADPCGFVLNENFSGFGPLQIQFFDNQGLSVFV
jgi:hypothetical protein